MATKTIETTITREEHTFLMRAMTELKQTGTTRKTCPRCGGELVHGIEGTHEYIKCSENLCVNLVARGI